MAHTIRMYGDLCRTGFKLLDTIRMHAIVRYVHCGTTSSLSLVMLARLRPTSP